MNCSGMMSPIRPLTSLAHSARVSIKGACYQWEQIGLSHVAILPYRPDARGCVQNEEAHADFASLARVLGWVSGTCVQCGIGARVEITPPTSRHAACWKECNPSHYPGSRLVGRGDSSGHFGEDSNVFRVRERALGCLTSLTIAEKLRRVHFSYGVLFRSPNVFSSQNLLVWMSVFIIIHNDITDRGHILSNHPQGPQK